MELKERIINENFRLLTTKSAKAITMDELASNLGISKRTLYENFSDKKTLLEECLLNFINKNKQESEKIWDESENAMVAFITYMQKANDLMNTIGFDLIMDIKKYFPEIFAHTFEKNMDDHRTCTLNSINTAISQGLIKKSTNIDFLINMIQLNMTYATGQEYILRNPNYTASSLANAHLYIILRGFATYEGMKILDKYDNIFLK